MVVDGVYRLPSWQIRFGSIGTCCVVHDRNTIAERMIFPSVWRVLRPSQSFHSSISNRDFMSAADVAFGSYRRHCAVDTSCYLSVIVRRSNAARHFAVESPLKPFKFMQIQQRQRALPICTACFHPRYLQLNPGTRPPSVHDISNSIRSCFSCTSIFSPTGISFPYLTLHSGRIIIVILLSTQIIFFFFCNFMFFFF